MEYSIPSMIVRDESIEYIQFSVPDCVIPVSFYTVNENNSKLDVMINGVKTSYTFPYGNYNATLFATQFKAILGSNWSIVLKSFNSVFTITNSATAFTFLESSTIDFVMGFSYTLSSTSVAPYSLTLTRPCNFLPLPRITLRCPELANTSMIGLNASTDVIITIPNNAKPNGQIYYQNQSQAKLLFRHHELSHFVIAFTDDDGNYINFNGISTFFKLQFDIFRRFIPKPPKFSDILYKVNNTTIEYPEEELIDADI